MRARRLSAIVLAGALAVAATAIAIRLRPDRCRAAGLRGTDSRRPDPNVGPGSLSSRDEAGWRPFVEGLLEAERKHELETEIVDLFPRRPPLGGFEPGSQDDVDRLSARLRSGDFDLVLWPLGLPGPRFFDVVPQYPDTRFVFLDYCCAKGFELGGAPNATALTLRAGQAAHLAGYLSGLMEARRTLPQGGRHVVSIISGEPNFPPQQALVQGFSTGVRRALPGVEIRSDYSFEYDDQATCERIANRQIDAGSGVVFATAGDCGLGALTAAAIRGVWGVATGERSLAPRPAHSRVCVPALRSPRRVDCELVPGRTAAAGWGRRARTRRRRRRARRYQPRRAPADPGQGCARSCAASSAGSAAARVTARTVGLHRGATQTHRDGFRDHDGPTIQAKNGSDRQDFRPPNLCAEVRLLPGPFRTSAPMRKAHGCGLRERRGARCVRCGAGSVLVRFPPVCRGESTPPATASSRSSHRCPGGGIQRLAGVLPRGTLGSASPGR